jgi:hypothetical protein
MCRKHFGCGLMLLSRDIFIFGHQISPIDFFYIFLTFTVISSAPLVRHFWETLCLYRQKYSRGQKVLREPRTILNRIRKVLAKNVFGELTKTSV